MVKVQVLGDFHGYRSLLYFLVAYSSQRRSYHFSLSSVLPLNMFSLSRVIDSTIIVDTICIPFLFRKNIDRSIRSNRATKFLTLLEGLVETFILGNVQSNGVREACF